MRLTLRQLEIFIAVARAGSTVAAAPSVALSQSATSAAVLELERLIGTPLFDRIGKKLVPNMEGRALLPDALALVGDLQALEQRHAGGVFAGSLRLAASTTIGNYVMPQLLAGFAAGLGPTGQAAFRSSQVRIANTAVVVQAVSRLDSDAGFIEGPCHEPGLAVEPWLEDELVLVAAPADPLAALAKSAPRGLSATVLRQARWLLREAGSGTREAVAHALLPHLHHVATSIEFGSSEAIKRAAAGGLGVSCLSRWVVQDFLDAGTLVQLKPAWPRMRRRFYIITAQHRASPALAQLLAYCRNLQGMPAPRRATRRRVGGGRSA